MTQRPDKWCVVEGEKIDWSDLSKLREEQVISNWDAVRRVQILRDEEDGSTVFSSALQWTVPTSVPKASNSWVAARRRAVACKREMQWEEPSDSESDEDDDSEDDKGEDEEDKEVRKDKFKAKGKSKAKKGKAKATSSKEFIEDSDDGEEQSGTEAPRLRCKIGPNFPPGHPKHKGSKQKGSDKTKHPSKAPSGEDCAPSPSPAPASIASARHRTPTPQPPKDMDHDKEASDTPHRKEDHQSKTAKGGYLVPITPPSADAAEPDSPASVAATTAAAVAFIEGLNGSQEYQILCSRMDKVCCTLPLHLLH